MSQDPNSKDAVLKLSLKAKSGYSCSQESIISANQWKDINNVIEGKLRSNDIWISVRHQMPDKGVHVMASDGISVWEDVYDDVYEMPTGESHFIVVGQEWMECGGERITHWVHKPAPPEKNNQVTI